MKTFRILIVSFCFLGIFAGNSFATADKDGPKIGDLPPPLTLSKTIQGSPATEITWDKFKGKVVVLEFWATWCGPCVQSIPHLNDLAEQFKDKPVVFISVTSENENVVRHFLKKHQMKAWLGLDDHQALNQSFHVQGIPHAVIVDAAGRIAAIAHPADIKPIHVEEVLAGKKCSLPEPAVYTVDKSADDTEVLTKIVSSFAQIKTHPLSLDGFNQMVRTQAGTNLSGLTEIERKKLFACLSRFYACYSSGSFDAYKQFRLREPYAVGEVVASFFKEKATVKGLVLKSDEETLRFGWDFENGTNKIDQVNDEKMALSVVRRSDTGGELHIPSVANNWPKFAGAQCWDAQINYQPTLDDLLEKEGSIRFFRLEFFARFNSNANGPAMPLVFVGYWDSKHEDWMPSAFCHFLSFGTYDTMF
ncbi:MAG: TlpA disulfide reductase family protein [Chlamydiia bacterium]